MLRGHHPGPGHAAYWISEEAVAAFSKCLGRDQASNGTRVNALCPSEVNTPTLRTGSVRPSYDPYTAAAEINSTVPLGRIAEPTHVVFFLCSDAARSVAGTAVELNDAKAHY
nr:SDR family oxidoreductase [Mesorhizobium sp.]